MPERRVPRQSICFILTIVAVRTVFPIAVAFGRSAGIVRPRGTVAPSTEARGPTGIRRAAGAHASEATAPRERAGTGFRHVLVPLDGSELSECALPFAAAVAAALSARVTLLRVLEMPEVGRAARQVDPLEWEMLRAEAHGQLSQLDGALKAHGISSTLEVVDGRSAEQIVRFAEQRDVDLIVLSTHGEGGLSAWSLSSTVQKVIARARGSILIVPAYAGAKRTIGTLRFRRILVALDCSPRAECVLPLAAALAHADGAELILAHVVPEPEIPRRLAPSAEDVALAERLTERNRVESLGYLTALADRMRLDGIKTEVRIVASARRAFTLRQIADREDVDLVVLCAHGSTGDPSERYGGVTARLIQEMARPLIVFQDLADAVRGTTPAETATQDHPGH